MATATIDSITQTSQLGSSGQSEDVIVAHFVTDQGDSGSVRVPMLGDWPLAVREAVAQVIAGYDLIRG